MATTQRDQAQLADCYALISASGKTGMTLQALREKGFKPEWCRDQLLSRNMIVRKGVAGCIDSVYVTVRNAK